MWPCQGLVILFQQWKFKQYKISKYEAVDQFAKKFHENIPCWTIIKVVSLTVFRRCKSCRLMGTTNHTE